jgi:hypothetical protein
MQRLNLFGAALAAAAMCLVSFTAQADGAKTLPDSAAAAPPVFMHLQGYSPTLRMPGAQWTMPPDDLAPVEPDKSAVILKNLLTIDDHVHLSPSGHSVIDVPRPDGADKPKGAYLNLKIDW